MKRRVWISTSLLALMVLVQFNCAAPPTNRDGSEAMPAASREVVDTAAIESEILRIENDYPRVLKEKDVAATRRVLADDAILIYPDGKLGDKATEIRDLEAGAMTFDAWELADLRVQVLDANAALATGRAIVRNGKIKLPDNKTLDITGQYRFVDTFHRKNGEWKLVAGSAVKMLEPMPSPPPAGSPAGSPAKSASPAARTSPATTASPAASKTP